MSNVKKFCDVLRTLMEENQTTQKELAEYLGITRQAISQYAIGKTSPDINTFKKIADYFDVSYDYLLGESSCKKRENINIEQSTGLSEKAIAVLQEKIKCDKEFLNVLSFLIEQEKAADINCHVLWKIAGFLCIEIPEGKMYEIVNNDIVKRNRKVHTELTEEYCSPVRTVGFSLRYLTHSLMLNVIEDDLRMLKTKYQQQEGGANGQHNKTE